MNHVTPLLVVTMPCACWFWWWVDYIEDFKWCLHFQFGVAFWKVVLRCIFWRAKSRLKGIEDFNLEHCSACCGGLAEDRRTRTRKWDAPNWLPPQKGFIRFRTNGTDLSTVYWTAGFPLRLQKSFGDLAGLLTWRHAWRTAEVLCAMSDSRWFVLWIGRWGVLMMLS